MAAGEVSSRDGGWRAMRSFIYQVLTGRWFMIFASLLIMSMSGATYMFGLYSGDIKSSLGYDQTTLNLIGFFKDVGGNIGIMSGLINEITPPWVVLSFGVIMNFFGYFMIWLAITGRTAKPHVWQMCLYICIGANSQTFSNTGALVTCVKNFPESRGIVIGLLKGLVGLSGAIITQLYHAFYGHDSKLYFPRVAYAGSASFVLFLLFSQLIVIIKEEINVWKSKRQESKDAIQLKVVSQLPNPPPVEELQPTIGDQASWWSNPFKPPERGEDYNILQAIFSIDMIILFTVTTFGVGGTLTAIDNLGQIGKSLGYPSKSITTFVSLVSIWNYLGRVASGFASEIFLEKYKFPRPLMLTLVLLLSCTGHLLIAFGVPNSLYLSSVIMGFCFGAQWPLIFAIISELFGLKYYSTLYTLGGGASPLGAYILNVRITGYLYDKEAMKQLAAKGLVRKEGQDLTCIGVECYKLAFLIIMAATLVACVISVILVLRTRKFYGSDIYKKFREQANRQE
ncbi:unnamed protein product [Fraxinus pennsylvanica]|uniref:Nodulin-like domain-containing protein n=1 Tax=Fraxinus pennsylvanica TaxID=56036 RepID=A0AAD2A920_9LAMI|nr:unnamed protein product [Fraxinus pennsylvanica]